MREKQLLPKGIPTICCKTRLPSIMILLSINTSNIWQMSASEITMSTDHPFVVVILIFRAPLIAVLYMTSDVSQVLSGGVDLISSKLIQYNTCQFVADIRFLQQMQYRQTRLQEQTDLQNIRLYSCLVVLSVLIALTPLLADESFR